MNRQKARSQRVPYGGAYATEALPFPIVHYPWSGIWIQFQEGENARPHFCSCFGKAIWSYLRSHREALDRHEYWYAFRDHSIKSLLNPNLFSGSIMDRYLQLEEDARLSTEAAMEIFLFRDKICHICNNKVPSYKYCVPMYGGSFRQAYGWYIEKYAWELGLRKAYFDQKYLNQIPKDLPQDVIEDIAEVDNAEPNGKPSEDKKNGASEDRDQLAKTAGSAKRRVERWIENQVREIVGYSQVGEGWTSETLLFKLITILHSTEVIEFHARPQFLGGLEIDIFLPQKRLAVEYQGIQHFKPIEHWGGAEALKKLQERDHKKRQLCEANGIRLIYFNYDEDLNSEIVRERLATTENLV